MSKEVPSAPHKVFLQGTTKFPKGEQYTGQLVVEGEKLKPNKDGIFDLSEEEAKILNATGYVCEIVPGSGKKKKE